MTCNSWGRHHRHHHAAPRRDRQHRLRHLPRRDAEAARGGARRLRCGSSTSCAPPRTRPSSTSSCRAARRRRPPDRGRGARVPASDGRGHFSASELSVLQIRLLRIDPVEDRLAHQALGGDRRLGLRPPPRPLAAGSGSARRGRRAGSRPARSPPRRCGSATPVARGSQWPTMSRGVKPRHQVWKPMSSRKRASRTKPSVTQPRTPLFFSVSAESSPMCATSRSFGCDTQMLPAGACDRRPVQASSVSCGSAPSTTPPSMVKAGPASGRSGRIGRSSGGRVKPRSPMRAHHVVHHAGVAGGQPVAEGGSSITPPAGRPARSARSSCRSG